MTTEKQEGEGRERQCDAGMCDNIRGSTRKSPHRDLPLVSLARCGVTEFSLAFTSTKDALTLSLRLMFIVRHGEEARSSCGCAIGLFGCEQQTGVKGDSGHDSFENDVKWHDIRSRHHRMRMHHQASLKYRRKDLVD